MKHAGTDLRALLHDQGGRQRHGPGPGRGRTASSSSTTDSSTSYSEPGQGTTFRIYLPLHDREPETVLAEKPETPPGGTETILVAEDDTALREIANTVLTRYGYTVVEAADGEEAVRKFMEHRDSVRLLLMDIIMPKMDGKEACDEIRKIRPDVKVIFCTGYAPDHLRQKLQLEGAFHLVQKPVPPSDLLRKVRSVLDEKA